MSREELRFCVIHEERIQSLEEAVSQQENALELRRLNVEKSERALSYAKEKVDVYSQPSVDSFNNLVERHAILVDDYNSRLPQLNNAITSRNKAVNMYNSTCAEKAYFEDDLAAINSERR